MIGRYYRRKRRAQRECFHHDRVKGTLWIHSRIIESGMRKMFWCDSCSQVWYT